MKNMYSIGYKKPNDNVIYSAWYGGNTEEEAKANAVKSGVSFHNRYNDNKLTEADLTIVECKYAGEYEKVLKDLQRD